MSYPATLPLKRGVKLAPIRESTILPQIKADSIVEEKSVFSKYLKVLDLLEERVTNYIYGKCDVYKDLRDSMIKFFQKETDEIFKMANEWHRKIESVRIQILSEDANILTNPLNSNNYNESTLLAQKIEAEIKSLKKSAQGMSDYEDRRLELITKTLKKVMGDAVPKDSEKLIVNTIDVRPIEKRQIMMKLDLHRRFDVYLLDLVGYTRKKYHFETMSIPIDSASVYVCGRYFLSGGRSENAKELSQFYINSTYEFEFESVSFVSKAPMHIEKRNHLLAGIEGQRTFYAFGGYNQKLGYLSACEKYSMDDNAWRLMPSLREARQDPTPCIVDSRFIYLFGGAVYADNAWTYPMTVEFFDTFDETKEWNKIVYTYDAGWTGRIHLGAAQISENRVLLFGGYNKGGQNEACFEYNILEKTILPVEDKKLPKAASFICRSAGLFTASDCIYAIAANSFDLFIYYKENGKWTVNSNWKPL
eukprot:TRINITY_DN7330_c0_g1_i1.p1 TRINITY_DN7330_c0_g1~~TRINITY_DN7330_c0_g1_i1.p1  ORF type:complete len:476 (+),score=119.67 TRINITY_DN7330_c0_g1_i1:110-1537(+)